MAIKKDSLPTKREVEQFINLNSVLNSIQNEIKEFAKKKPDGTLNKIKIQIINRCLEQTKAFLTDSLLIDFLDLLDEDSMPTYSDAVLVIAHHVTAMTKYSNNYFYSDSDFELSRWHTAD